jgi:hypothetical protein
MTSGARKKEYEELSYVSAASRRDFAKHSGEARRDARFWKNSLSLGWPVLHAVEHPFISEPHAIRKGAATPPSFQALICTWPSLQDLLYQLTSRY